MKRGYILDTSGSGIGNVRLQFARREHVTENGKRQVTTRVLAERKTRGDGSFDIPQLPKDKSFLVFTQADGFFPFGPHKVVVHGHVYASGTNLHGGAGDPRKLQLVRSVAIRGRVVGPNGRALAGAPLSVSTSSELKHGGFHVANHLRAVSDEQGYFQFHDVPPGEIVLFYPWAGPTAGEVRGGTWKKWTRPAERSPRVPTQGVCWLRVFNAGEGETVDGLEVDLSKSTCAVEGTVTDQTGRRMSDARVVPVWKRQGAWASVHGLSSLPSIRTDRQGRYHATGMPPGEVFLSVSSSNVKVDFQPGAVELVQGETAQKDLRVTTAARPVKPEAIPKTTREQALLWPPELDRKQLAGAWYRAGGIVQQHVLMLHGDGAWMEAWLRGSIDNPQSVEYVTRTYTPWHLRFENPRRYLNPSVTGRRAPNRQDLFGTWISHGGEDDGRDVFRLNADSTWWRATIAGPVDAPNGMLGLSKFRGTWSLKRRDTAFYVQFGKPIRHRSGGETAPPTMPLTAIYADCLIGQPTFGGAIMIQPTFDRATNEQAARFHRLVANAR